MDYELDSQDRGTFISHARKRSAAKAEREPLVGDVVHYKSYGTPGGEYTPQCRAAIVTEVPLDFSDAPTIGLAVLNPEGFFFNRGVHHDESHGGGTWHWPESE